MFQNKMLTIMKSIISRCFVLRRWKPSSHGSRRGTALSWPSMPFQMLCPLRDSVSGWVLKYFSENENAPRFSWKFWNDSHCCLFIQAEPIGKEPSPVRSQETSDAKEPSSGNMGESLSQVIIMIYVMFFCFSCRMPCPMMHVFNVHLINNACFVKILITWVLVFSLDSTFSLDDMCRDFWMAGVSHCGQWPICKLI